MQKHRTPHDKTFQKNSKQSFLEAQIVDLADEIAYQSHDIDDGLRAEILKFDEIKTLEIFQILFSKFDSRNFDAGKLINILLRDALEKTVENLKNLNLKSADEIRNLPQKVVEFSPRIYAANEQLRQFLQTRFYRHEFVKTQSDRGAEIIKKLFFHFLKNPRELPQNFAEKNENLETKIKDFIAGMTDDFAVNFAKKIP